MGLCFRYVENYRKKFALSARLCACSHDSRAVEGINQIRDLKDIYKVAVIGGGVVGCAILRQLTLSGIECILLERAPCPLSGASGGMRFTLEAARICS